jgi:hypothetical protein
MEHEGMVHALEEIHRLLRTDGVLLEIHPVDAPPTIEVHADGEVRFAEPDPGFDWGVDVREAESAIAEVVRRGLFAVDGVADFGLLTHSGSARELREYFEISGAYDDAPREELLRQRDAVYVRAEASMTSTEEPTTLVYSERGHMNRLVRQEA